MPWFALAAILAAGCSGTPERLDQLFAVAEADVRAGEMFRAQAEIEHGLSLAAERHDVLFQWRFRLLRAEVLLFSRRAEPVLADMEEPMPPGPRFAPL